MRRNTRHTKSGRKPNRTRQLRWTSNWSGSRKLLRTIEALETRTMLTVSITGVPTWIEQGPAPTQNGQVQGMGSQSNPVVGAVEAIAADPTNADNVYIVTVNGGVWHTTNATNSNPIWTPLTDKLSGLSMASIVFDPLDATRNTLWVGYGRVSSGNRDGGPCRGSLRRPTAE